MGSFSTVEILMAAAMVALFVAMPIWNLIRDRTKHRRDEADRDKAEAMFPALFPELQPVFHPRNVLDYAEGRLERWKEGAVHEWRDPPGFITARKARIEKTDKGEKTVLLDDGGKILGEFLFNRDDRPSVLATLRTGQGKFTVKQKLHRAATVSYWHPDREFVWRGERLWEFKTKVADEPIRSDSDGMSWSNDSSSSSGAARVAGAAALVGAGGAFDGGGASQSWDNAPATGDGGSGEMGSAAAAGSSDSDSSFSDSSSSDSGSSDTSGSSTSY